MLTWQSPPGLPWQVDTALVDPEPGALQATGKQIGLEPLPYTLAWALETSEPWVTRRLTVWVQGEDWSRSLHLTHDGAGSWRYDVKLAGTVDLPDPGGDTTALTDALDCDLGRCPLTNTMPVLRHRLHTGPGTRDPGPGTTLWPGSASPTCGSWRWASATSTWTRAPAGRGC